MNHTRYCWATTMACCLFYLLLCPSLALAQNSTEPMGCQPLPPPNARFGINVARDGGKEITDYDVAQLHAGWYLDYTWHIDPAHPNGMDYVQMIRRWREDAGWQAQLAAAIEANPGSLWILGNEPDHRAQDNRTPVDYAMFYHTAYAFLKERDPTSQVAIAAVTQPTPLRLRYLEQVLSAYQERYATSMPIDVWTVHAYVLPENAGWGVGIPPGMDAFAAEGRIYTIADHGNLKIFATQLRAFRQWLAQQGYRDKPLLVTEFGILFPPDYGYPDDKISDFMRDSMTWLQQASDPQTGYAADANRLVQGWAWFSMNYYAYDPATGIGHNGHLLDHQTGEITPVGRAFVAYVAPRVVPTPELIIVAATVTPSTIASGTNPSLAVQLTIANQGYATAKELTLAVGWGKDARMERVHLPSKVAPHCTETISLTINWTPPQLAQGRHILQVAVATAGKSTAEKPLGQPIILEIQVP